MPRTLGVIPARGGSKGIPGKNLKLIGGKSLVARAIEFTLDLEWIDVVYCSTDSGRIKKEAIDAGAEVPELRPEEISGDRASDKELLVHAIEMYKRIGLEFDYIALFQPTCPTREKDEADSCYRKIIDERLEMVLTVSEVSDKYHPLKQIIEEKTAKLYDRDGACIIARQQLSKTYIRNGGCYVFRAEHIMNDQAIFDCDFGIIKSKKIQINIDEVNDLEAARELLEDAK